VTDDVFPEALPTSCRVLWYVIERVLGQGGFGTTYFARDTNLDRPVAIKEYLPLDVAVRGSESSVRPKTQALGERFMWGKDRFKREAQTLAQFDHPNIVRVQAVFEANDTVYMVMRFEEGDNLGKLLDERHTLTEPELLNILLPVLDGLTLVHEAGFIHRDIKPENIHMRRDGSPVLLDFGSARQPADRSQMTVLVARGYAPLEQYYSDPAQQGPWTDIYALAATCYRVVSGVAPTDVLDRIKGKGLGTVTDGLRPAIQVGRGRFSEHLLRAIDHGLELQGANRPQSIKQWRDELVDDAVPAAVAGASNSTKQNGKTALQGERNPVPISSAAAGANPLHLLAGLRSHRLAWTMTGFVAAAMGFGALRLMHSTDTQGPANGAGGPLTAISQPAMTPPITAPAATPIATPVATPSTVQSAVQPDRAGVAGKQSAKESAPQGERATRIPISVNMIPAKEAADTHAATFIGTAIPKDKPETMSPAVPAAIDPPINVAVAPMTSDTKSAPPPAAHGASDLLAQAERLTRNGDYERALSIIGPLARAGDPDAQQMKGEACELGRGMKASAFEAYMWFSLASRKGSLKAETAKMRVASKLQPVEIRQADNSVAKWKATVDGVESQR
jgi:serine/threonine protein kinase